MGVTIQQENSGQKRINKPKKIVPMQANSPRGRGNLHHEKTKKILILLRKKSSEFSEKVGGREAFQKS